MRLKGGTMDLGVRAYYSPPFGGSSGARRKVQMTGLDENFRVGPAEFSRSQLVT